MTLISRIAAPGPKILTRTSGVAKVAIRYSQSPNFTTGVVTTAQQNPNSLGVTQFTLTGLQPGAGYYYRVVMDNAADTEATVGEFKAPPSGRSSFSFSFGSCSRTDAVTYSSLFGYDDDLFFHHGDLWYADGASTALSNYRTKLQTALTGPRLAKLLATRAFCYTPSDHDSGMANDTYVPANIATFRQAYLENVPTLTTASGGLYYSFAWGRVRFVMLDCRSFKSAPSVPDGPGKTMLGQAQKDWLKDLYATAPEPLFILINDMTFSGSALSNSTSQTWRNYASERAELIQASQGKPTIVLSGDVHQLAVCRTAAPGWVEWVSSGIEQHPAGAMTGGPWDQAYPNSAQASDLHLYGRVTVTDDGQDIVAAFTGYEYPNTPRVSDSFTVFAPVPSSPVIVVPPPPTVKITTLPDVVAPPSLFDLRVVNPALPNLYGAYLDDWSDLSVVTDRKAPGEMKFTYPYAGTARAEMRAKQLLVFLQDGREGDNCRFILRNCDTNLINDATQVEDYQFMSIFDALKDTQFLPPSGATKTRTWTNQTVGTQLLEVMNTANARGAFDWWGYQGVTFTAANDSAGKPWPVIERMEHEYGISVFEVWDWLIQQNYIDVTTTKGKLNAFNREGGGTDRVAQTNPVILFEGVHLDDAPQQETWDDFVNYLTVIGGETPDPADETKTLPRIYVTLNSGVGQYGRREKSIKIEGVQSVAELTKIGQAYLKTFTGPRTSRTYSVSVTNQEKRFTILGIPDDVAAPNPIPMLDYRVGDIIGVSIADGLALKRERVEVISATVTGKESAKFLITVNDWIDHRQLIRDRTYRLQDKQTT